MHIRSVCVCVCVCVCLQVVNQSELLMAQVHQYVHSDQDTNPVVSDSIRAQFENQGELLQLAEQFGELKFRGFIHKLGIVAQNVTLLVFQVYFNSAVALSVLCLKVFESHLKEVSVVLILTHVYIPMCTYNVDRCVSVRCGVLYLLVVTYSVY